MKYPLFAVLLCCSTTLVNAAPVDELRQLVADCDAARETNDFAAGQMAATQIPQLEGPFFNTKLEMRAKDCLTEYVGGSWTYSNRTQSFATTEIIEAEAAIRALREEAEETLKSLRQEGEAEQQRLAQEIVGAERTNNARSAAAVEELRSLRTDHVVSRTAIACTALFQRDEVEALTNPVCNKVFLASGLPEE